MKAEVRFYRRWVTLELTVWLVGKIVHLTGPLVEAWPNGRLGVTPPTPSLIPSETVHETTDKVLTTDDNSTGVQEPTAWQRSGILHRQGPPSTGSKSARDSGQQSEVCTNYRSRLIYYLTHTFGLALTGISLGHPQEHCQRGS